MITSHLIVYLFQFDLVELILATNLSGTTILRLYGVKL